MDVLNGQGYVELVQYMGDELMIINAAKLAYNGKATEMGEHERQLLLSLISNGHTSPLEHVVFTFHVKAPIFVIRQWFRHRTHSYSELSRRYVKGNVEVYMPENGKEVYREAYHEALTAYQHLIDSGLKAEEARIVLPLGLMSEFYDTVDLNNLLKFLALRDDFHAQAEIREYAIAIKKLVAPCLPTIADKLGW